MKKEDKILVCFVAVVILFLLVLKFITSIHEHNIEMQIRQNEIEHNAKHEKLLQQLNALQEKYKEELAEIKHAESIDVFTLNYNDIELLAINNYYESRGVAKNNFNKKRKDMINITSVVLNRVESKKYGNSIREVLYSYKIKRGKRVCQFSWACEKTKAINKNSKEWQLAYDVAFEVYTGLERRKISKNAHHYYNPKKVNPRWAKNSKEIAYVFTGHKIIEIK